MLRATAVVAIVLGAVPILRAAPKPIEQQPFPDAAEYADASFQLSHGNGYATYVHEGLRKPPRYPPGFSALLAPFARWAGDFPQGAQRGAKILVLASFVAVCLVAWGLAGPVAGALAALIAGTSPFYSTMATLVMSDAVGAMLTVLPLLLLVRPRVVTSAFAGVITGAGVVVRLASLLTLIGLVLALGRTRLALAAVAGALPFVLLLLASQWLTLGHPLKTGYDYYFPALQEFDLDYVREVDLAQKEGPYIVDDRLHGELMDWVCPCVEGGPMRDLSNITFYPALTAGLFWVFTPPLVGLLAFWELIYRRRSVIARYSAFAIAANMILFASYFHQGARLLAPTGALLVVFAAAFGARLARVFLHRVLGTPQTRSSDASF